ncbi:MAG: hypothetical protein ABIO68_04110 [Sphingomicrobium sp.]
MLARFAGLALAMAIGLVWAGTASATPGQNEACITSVSSLRDVDQQDVTIEGESGGGAGPTEIFFRTPNVRGSCLFDSSNRLIDVRMAGGTLPWNGRGGGNVSAQEQACAGETARRFNLPITSVAISDVRPARRGGRQMVASAPGVRVRCVTTQFNAITEFAILQQ